MFFLHSEHNKWILELLPQKLIEFSKRGIMRFIQECYAEIPISIKYALNR